MNDKPEKRAQNRIFTTLLEVGALVLRVNSGAAQTGKPEKSRFIRFVMWRILGELLTSAGVSDLLACYKGRFIAIEVKAPGKRGNLSDAQARFLDAVEKAGGIAIVADDPAIVWEALNGI